MKKLLVVAALSEGATGLILLAYPPIVIRLLFGEEIAGAGVIMSRVAGISLIALGVACRPDSASLWPLYGMLTYSSLVMLYLAYVGFGGEAGILLWPAVAVHAILSVLLVREWLQQRKTPEATT